MKIERQITNLLGHNKSRITSLPCSIVNSIKINSDNFHFNIWNIINIYLDKTTIDKYNYNVYECMITQQ